MFGVKYAIMPISAKGSRRERELLELLTRRGFVVHRVAGSGKGEVAVCDLIAVKNGKVDFIECKSRKKIYYPADDAEQLRQLILIAKTARARPILAVKLAYRPWRLIDISKRVPPRIG